MDIVSGTRVRAAALSLVSADTRIVDVRMQLSHGQLTLDLSKHIV